MAKTILEQDKTFKVPTMSNYDYKKDMNFTVSEVNMPNEEGLYDYESMKGEMTYHSPREASEEALRKIKAAKRSGVLARFALGIY